MLCWGWKLVYNRYMNIANKTAILLIKAYQATLSPDKWLFSPWLKGRVCAHEPHCSEYAIQCFRQYPFFQALTYTFDRIMTCTPSHHKKHDPSSYRVVFASGAPIGVPFLQAISDDPRYELVWVVTMPDAARDRWQKVKENVIKLKAKSLKLKTVTPHSLRLDSKKYASEAKEFQNRLQNLDVDFLVVVAYGKIIPRHILEIPKVWPINVHGSLLPRYRGASPLQSVFIDGESKTWVTVMLMDEWLDTGDMLSKLKTKLPLSWTVKDLISRIQNNSPKHLLETLWDYAKWDIHAKPQDEALVTHCSKIEKNDGKIDLHTDTLREIYQKYQAYALWPKIFFYYNDNKRAIIESIEIDEEKYLEQKNLFDEAFFGLFGQPQDHLTHLNPLIKNITIKPEWKKAMNWQEFQSNFLTK